MLPSAHPKSDEAECGKVDVPRRLISKRPAPAVKL